MFIERPSDGSPGAAEALAARVASRFGAPESVIAGRLRQGRLRVKAGIELPKARRFVAELESLGAVCSIVDDQGRSVPLVEPAPEPEGDFLTLEDPPAPAPEPVGLSVGASAAPQDLGALGPSGDSGGLMLAALDGSGAATGGPGAPAQKPSRDAFLPPEMLEESSLELLTPPPEIEAGAGASTPGVSAPVSPAASAPATSAPAPARDAGFDEPPPPAAAPAPRPRRHPLEALASSPRLRLGVGVALAVLLGFSAAHLVAAMRESGYADIRGEVIEAQAAVVSEDQWNALDGVRAAALERLEARKSNAVVSALAVWAIVGGGIAFAWQRKIDWSRWQRRDQPDASDADLA